MSKDYKDYYKILGVSKTATQPEIKKAFRKLAHEHHPDKHGGDDSRFKEINEAYQVLGNAEKRKQYDQFGSVGSAGFGGGASGYGGQGFNWQDFARQAQSSGFQGNVDFDLGDIFGDIFGGGGRGRSRRSARGADIEIALTIEFKEAIFGVEKNIALNRKVKCHHCGGNGAEPGTKIITCKTCNGKGQVTSTQRTILGTFQTSHVCSECRGEGKSNEQNCKICSGVGVETKREEIKVAIPAGINNGETLRMRGEGNAGIKGAENGDLFVAVAVRKDKNFERQGTDIFTRANITFSQAALGGKIDIDTVYGSVKLKIPVGTQSGKQFILRGKGVPRIHSKQKGDQIVEVRVETPTNLSSKAKKLLEELAGEEKKDKKSWF